MGVRLTDRQRGALATAKTSQEHFRYYTTALEVTVRQALIEGVPLNTLATALGVSRSRVRRLARVEKSE